MLRGLRRDQLKALGLTKPDDYYYLTQVLCVLAIIALCSIYDCTCYHVYCRVTVRHAKGWMMLLSLLP